MSKVASAANLMGVGEDQLAAQLSTIISVTREAPETIGTSLKTIYARINDIQAGVSEDGVSLGNYSGKMAELGINVLDANGKLRDMGEVMEEIGGKWGTLSKEQQVYLAQTMAGQRQYSRLLALFDNWDKYAEALNTAQNAAGTLQQQQDIYMESTEAHLNTLRASLENIYDSFINTDSINSLVDGLSGAANIAATFIDSIGGGGQLLQDLGTIGFTVFSQQIAKGINTTITNLETAKNNARQFDQALQTTREWQGIPGLDKVSEDLLKNREQLLQLAKLMSPEQFSGMQKLLNDITAFGNKIASLKEQESALKAAVQGVRKGNDAWKSYDEVMNSALGRRQVSARLQKQENKFKQLTKALETYKGKLKELNKESNFSEAKKELDEYFKTIKKLQAQGLLNNHINQIEALQKEINKLDDSFDSEDFVPDEIILTKMQAIASEFQAISSKVKKQTQDVRKKFQKEAEQTSDSIKQKIKETEEYLNKAQNDFDKKRDNTNRTKTIQSYAKLAGGIGQVAMSVEQLQNLGSIWRNDDLTIGEQMLQTVTNLTMSLPMLVSGISSVKTALGLLTGGASIAMGVLGGVLAVMAISASVYQSYEKKQEEIRENSKKINDEKIEEAKQEQAEIASHQELLKSLEELDQQYKNGQITRDELKSTVQSLIQQYGLEGDAADELANSYDNLASYIQKTSLAKAEALAQSTKDQRNAAESNLKLAAQDSDFFDVDDEFVSLSSSRWGQNEDKQILSELKKAGFLIIDPDSDYATGYEAQQAILQTNLKSGEDIVESYEKIQKIIQNIDALHLDSKILGQSEYYKQLKDVLTSLSEAYNEYKDSAERAEEAAANFALKNSIKNDDSLNFKEVQNMDEYFEKRSSLIKKLKQEDSNLSNKAATERVDNYLQENFSNVYDSYDKAAKKIDEVSKKFKVSTEDVKNAISGLNGQQLTAFVDLDLNSIKGWESLGDILQKISEMDFSNTDALKVDTEAIKEAASDRYSFFQSLEDQVLEGKGISKATFKSLGEQEGGAQLQQYFDIMANGT